MNIKDWNDYAAAALRNMTDRELRSICERLGMYLVDNKSRAELEAYWRASKGPAPH